MPTVLMLAWAGNQFTPLLLLYRQVEGYSTLEVDLFFGAYILGIIPTFIVAGSLSDRYGRKPLINVALALCLIAAIVLALGSATPAMMMLGRLISGCSVGIGMVVGTSWIKELSVGVPAATAARRASLTMTAGFMLGAVVAGALAQWAPWPTVLPYVVQVGATAAAACLLFRVPETRSFDAEVTSLVVDIAVPPGYRRRFWLVVVPMAPWVFAAPALAFAVAPALAADRLGSYGIAFAGMLSLVSLGAGLLIQSGVRRLMAVTRGASGAVGLVLLAIGTVVLAVNTDPVSPWLTVVAAILLGCAFGVCMLSGLIEVQAMAGPHNLAGLTGLYYALTYLGFALPALLSWLALRLSIVDLLHGVVVAVLICAVITAVGAISGAGRPPTSGA
ncbi:MFS transporter [Millisia brevis]|uniref:MFS transporter n=1 Tax=Millisia brevis TaxID=264148 RepID=UPI000A02EE85|nr:MFS transporter [Millisia brevis]